MATPITKDMPKWEQELLRKHEMQMLQHQQEFGILGHPQTRKQKMALQRTITLLEQPSLKKAES